MIITLFPLRSAHPMTLARAGSTLTVDGVQIDLVPYVQGDNDAIIGQPEHDGSTWHVNLVLPHGADAPPATLFPAQIMVEGEGPIPLPAYDAEPV